jgi:hypothetical protein
MSRGYWNHNPSEASDSPRLSSESSGARCAAGVATRMDISTDIQERGDSGSSAGI